MQHWFGHGGKVFDSVRDRLLDSSSPLHEWFEPKILAALITKNKVAAVWLLLFLDEWLRQNRRMD
jgi:hypothetical protein